CQKVISGGAYRLKHHLAGTNKDVEPCIVVNDELKAEMLMIVASLQQNLINKSNSFLREEEQTKVGEKRKESENLFKRKGISTQVTINNMFKKGIKEEVNQAIARCFYNNAIPFNVARSDEYFEMFELVAKHGPGFKPPSYHEIRVKYLKQEVKLTNDRLEEHKAKWKKVGCTIMTDGWTDKRRRTILNFLVHIPKGTIFLKSIDASHIAKTVDRIFKMIDEVVEEIGEDNVVQVVTDNASNYKAAGEMLMAKRKKLYWTPCAAHCIDLMLEEFEKKIPIHADTIYKEWKATKFARTHDGRLIEDVMIDEKPLMGLIYEAMDQAKEKIQSAYNSLEDRWDRQLHRPLHAAGYFLNPQLHYVPGFTVDLEVRNGLFDAIGRMVPDIQDQSKIAVQMDRFTNKRGFFGKPLALATVNQKTPADWWDFFGDETPELKRFALRVLSLTCSSSGCERNWSAFEMVHTKRRNKLKQETMNDVIFVMANSKLSKKKQARKGVELTIDDIPSDDEWIVEHNNEDEDHLDSPEGDGDDLMREILGEDVGEDIDDVEENEDEAPLEDDYREFDVNDLLN
ncbi:hypothetical protein Lal_00029220, partial [Lupinus albus]